MSRKMFPTCTDEFLKCKKEHYGIELEIEDFDTVDKMDEIYEEIKELIERRLKQHNISWIYLTKNNGHLMNCSTERIIFGEDPHGNRSDGERERLVLEK